jgi:hypothetical protein
MRNLQLQQNKVVHFENTAWEHDGATYFALAISYAHKMFINSITGVDAIKLFSFVYNALGK